MQLTIIGSGRAAWTFATVLSGESWVESVRIGSRSSAPAFEAAGLDVLSIDKALEREASHLLLAVPDDQIAMLWTELSTVVPADLVPFHVSGSLSSELFGERPAFSLHPLAALPRPGEEVGLEHALFAYEGDPSTRPLADRVVGAFGGRLAPIAPADKTRYHAAAVIGANYVATLLGVATRMLEETGIEEPEEALVALARSAIESWRAGNYTGPIPRGDVEVVERHLAALGEKERHLYVVLARSLVLLLRDEDAEVPSLQQFEELLEQTDHS